MVSFGKNVVIGIVILVLIVGAYVFFANSATTGLFLGSSTSEEIKLGALLPLSGNLATIGINSRNGMELAKIDLVKENQKRNISYIFEDSCYPKETIPAFSKLTNIDNIDMLGISFCIVGFVPLIPEVQKEKIVAFSAPASPDALLNQSGVFSFNKSIKLDSTHLATFAHNELKAKTAAIVFYNTQLGADYNLHLTESFEKLGGKVVYFGVTEVERVDFRAELIAIKEKNPDVIYIIQLANPLGLFIKQAKELGITSTILSQSTAEDPSVLSASQGASEGLIISSSQTRVETQKMKEFKIKYNSLFGKDPDAIAAIAYDSIILQIKAFEKCSGEVNCIQKEIFATKDYSGASGVISMNSEGSTDREANFKIVKNGKFVLYESN
jgi:branched-chain amino acid transport system substrate-binding protein